VFNKKRKGLQIFLSQIKMYLLFNSIFILNSTDNILIAGTYLRKKAYKWYNMYLQNHLKCKETLNTRKKNTKKIINDYEEFEKALK